MIILKAKNPFVKIEEQEKELTEKLGTKVCIIPCELEIVNDIEGIEEIECAENFLELKDLQNEKKTDLSITVGVEVDEKSFEYAKEKIAELNNEKIYEVITKDTYIYDYICSMGENANIDFIKDQWGKISNGFNFVIKFKDEYYSVEKFNEVIRG
nr:MAG TPA: hypothetical protein [Caudoviricetes sp.]